MYHLYNEVMQCDLETKIRIMSMLMCEGIVLHPVAEYSLRNWMFVK